MSKAESVYFEAYTGEHGVDQDVRFRNKFIFEATNIDEATGEKEKRQYENNDFLNPQMAPRRGKTNKKESSNTNLGELIDDKDQVILEESAEQSDDFFELK